MPSPEHQVTPLWATAMMLPFQPDNLRASLHDKVEVVVVGLLCCLDSGFTA